MDERNHNLFDYSGIRKGYQRGSTKVMTRLGRITFFPILPSQINIRTIRQYWFAMNKSQNGIPHFVIFSFCDNQMNS